MPENVKPVELTLEYLLLEISKDEGVDADTRESARQKLKELNKKKVQILE
jgi:hypothetical protein